MKTLIYQVYTGKRSKLYDHCTYSVAEYAERIGAEYIQQRQPILMIKPDVFQTNRNPRAWEQYGGFLPIFEKQNAFAYLKSYDQVAVIDADVWIRPECIESIFEEVGTDVDFAASIERDMPITPQYERRISKYTREQYGMVPISKLFDWKDKKGIGAEFRNMGVMVINKSLQNYLNGETPRQFLSRPRFKPFVDGLGNWKWSTDQTLLNVWIKEENMKVHDLHWKWNGLFTANTKIKQCNFVHFFLKQKLPNNGENVDQLMELV